MEKPNKWVGKADEWTNSVCNGCSMGCTISYGINDDFIRSLAEGLTPDSSALFLLIRKVQPEKVLEELRPFKGRVLRTSLSPEQEERLQKAIADVAHS